MSATTPAGVFIIDTAETSDYYNNEPMFRLRHGKFKSPIAFHAPPNYAANSSNFSNINTDNTVSTGCIRGKCGDADYVFKNNLL